VTVPPATSPDHVFDLTGRRALVTGASSGLGRRMALALAHAGAQVAVTARRAELLEELAAEHPSIEAFPADLGSADDRVALVAAVEERFGGIDVLVNNAGIADPKPIEKETLEDFATMLEINLVSAWHLSKLAGVGMVERESGSIINIASIIATVAATPVKQTGYPAAKGGLVALTRELAVQWARKGVRVNAICPGWFETEMTSDLVGTEKGDDFIGTNTPLQRAGHVQEMDGPLLLLASDAGSFMTGAVVMVDGGWTAR
jgi:NAD(P)-dependent dehydrogenase (short-subunit alcohol dehydrogenase family)